MRRVGVVLGSGNWAQGRQVVEEDEERGRRRVLQKRLAPTKRVGFASREARQLIRVSVRLSQVSTRDRISQGLRNEVVVGGKGSQGFSNRGLGGRKQGFDAGQGNVLGFQAQLGFPRVRLRELNHLGFLFKQMRVQILMKYVQGIMKVPCAINFLSI